MGAIIGGSVRQIERKRRADFLASMRDKSELIA